MERSEGKRKDISHTYDMVSSRAIPANEEVMNTYDARGLSNVELLCRYGFVLEGNAKDVVSFGEEEIAAAAVASLEEGGYWLKEEEEGNEPPVAQGLGRFSSDSRHGRSGSLPFTSPSSRPHLRAVRPLGSGATRDDRPSSISTRTAIGGEEREDGEERAYIKSSIAAAAAAARGKRPDEIDTAARAGWKKRQIHVLIEKVLAGSGLIQGDGLGEEEEGLGGDKKDEEDGEEAERSRAEDEEIEVLDGSDNIQTLSSSRPGGSKMPKRSSYNETKPSPSEKSAQGLPKGGTASERIRTHVKKDTLTCSPSRIAGKGRMEINSDGAASTRLWTRLADESLRLVAISARQRGENEHHLSTNCVSADTREDGDGEPRFESVGVARSRSYTQSLVNIQTSSGSGSLQEELRVNECGKDWEKSVDSCVRVRTHGEREEDGRLRSPVAAGLGTGRPTPSKDTTGMKRKRMAEEEAKIDVEGRAGIGEAGAWVCVCSLRPFNRSRGATGVCSQLRTTTTYEKTIFFIPPYFGYFRRQSDRFVGLGTEGGAH